MYKDFQQHLNKEIQSIREAGLYKNERIITTPQGAGIKTEQTGANNEVINFCANNYLGLSSHPKVIEAAKKAIAHDPDSEDKIKNITAFLHSRQQIKSFL